jgi:hypothetical protein
MSHRASSATPFSLAALAALAAALPLAACGGDTGASEDFGKQSGTVDQTNVDMADYVLPSCDKAGPAWQIGSEQFRVVPMGMKGGLGRFAIVKSADGSGFEEWYIDSDWLRIRSDTTWAYERSPGGAWCDVKCGDNTFESCQQRWNTNPSDPLNGLSPSSPWALTTYHEPGNEALAAAFILRRMALPVGGEHRFTTYMEIKGADRDMCGGCWVNFGTKDGQSVSRTVVARRYGSWHGFEDVVHLAVESGPGAGESYFYARGKGWVGFNDKVASTQVDSATMPQSGCMSFQQGSVCEAVGQPGDPTNPPPPPAGDGTCDCQSGVDNFCLYKASTADCGMTAPGGYCDPNGDGDFGDADWVRGYNEYKDACSGGSPPPPPPPACECKSGVNNYCLYPVKTAGCDMTMPGGYCDPNGDGSFDDANWDKGFYDYQAACQ